ncbi:MAG: NFACT family protein [Candidatus Marinimicrobia bacterium]|nr:NFACT family protein [Candidatus Neomarinimicrobiota bacterium]
MFNSWFHIRSIARYLQSVLPDSVIGSSYTYQKDELVIRIDNCDALQGLQASLHAPLPCLQMETKLSDPKRRVSLFKTMTGLQIAGVAWHRSDRQILITFKNGTGYLLLQLYGINGNIFFLNQELRMIESFQKTRKEPVVDLNSFTDDDALFVPEATFRRTVDEHPDFTLDKIITLFPIPVYTKTLAGEIFYRAGLPEKTLVINLSEKNIQDLYLSYQAALEEIDQNHYYIYESTPPLFALLKLQFQKTVEMKSFDNIIAANQHYISLFYRTDSLAQIRRQLSSRLTISLQMLQRKLNKQKIDLSNLPTAAEYREWADTLLTNLHRIHGHLTEIELPTLHNTNQRIRIPLNPKLSAAENANKYYEKSRQIEDSRAELQHSLENTGNSIREIAGQLKAVDECDNLKTMRQIQQQIPARFIQQQAGPESVERKPYHRFLINDREILIGKSAKDNDLLSFKHARPEDFWFHAEHGPGSHVVVRNPNKQDSLPNELIEIAAGIAAFYSKAKRSTIVPVIYTKRKYIWKRKDMPPGKVFTKFTKSVIVKPLDPREFG